MLKSTNYLWNKFVPSNFHVKCNRSLGPKWKFMSLYHVYLALKTEINPICLGKRLVYKMVDVRWYEGEREMRDLTYLHSGLLN